MALAVSSARPGRGCVRDGSNCVRSSAVSWNAVKSMAVHRPARGPTLARLAKEENLSGIQIIIEASTRTGLPTRPVVGYQLRIREPMHRALWWQIGRCRIRNWRSCRDFRV